MDMLGAAQIISTMLSSLSVRMETAVPQLRPMQLMKQQTATVVYMPLTRDKIYDHKIQIMNHESRIANCGFTLLEILIALIIFTLAVVVIAGLFSTGLISSLDSENTTIAMNLAQRRMEEIRNLGFTNINDEFKGNVADFPGFQREVEISDPPGDPMTDDLKEITVTVYWTYKGEEVDVSLETYVSRN